MYKYTKKTLLLDFTYAAILFALAIFINVHVMYRAGIGFVGLLILRDSLKEIHTSFDLEKDRLLIKRKGLVVKEVAFKSILYVTITRRHKHWVVLANDEGILYTIKPKIENYEDLVARLLDFNKKNKKLEVHDHIKQYYNR